MPKPDSKMLRKLKNNSVLLNKMGYRRISNSSTTVARVDRPDWQNVLIDHGLRLVADEMSAADHYRRCYSEDRVTLEPSVYKQVKGSCGDSTGYVDSNFVEHTQKVISLPSDETTVKVSELDDLRAKGSVQQLTMSEKFTLWLNNRRLIS